MNTKQFKTFLKEAVREVIKEELSDILKEAVLSNRKTQEFLNEEQSFKFNSNDVITKPSNGAFRSKLNEMYGINTEIPSKTIPKQVEAVVEAVGGEKNPFASMFAQTAAEMTSVDRANLSRLD